MGEIVSRSYLIILLLFVSLVPIFGTGSNTADIQSEPDFAVQFDSQMTHQSAIQTKLQTPVEVSSVTNRNSMNTVVSKQLYTTSANSAFGVSDNPTTINMSGPEASPIAQDDLFVGLEDTQISGDLRANDNDPDNSTNELSYSVFVDVNSGSLTLYTNGTFTYTPDADFFGSDSFTYEVSDGNSTDTALATLIVNPVNDAPVAQDDTFGGNDNVQIIGQVNINDNDVDNATGSSILPNSGFETGSLSPWTGTAFVSSAVNYRFEGSYGAALFTNAYIEQSLSVPVDSIGEISFYVRAFSPTSGTVTINYSDGNSTQFAMSQVTAWTKQSIDLMQLESGKTISSLRIQRNTSPSGGYYGVDSVTVGLISELTYSLITDVQNGTLALNPDGSFTYDPDTGFSGTDSFIYQVSDGHLTDTATVTLNIIDFNDAPVTQDDSFAGNEDTALIGDVSLNDYDIDNSSDELTFTVETNPSSGLLQLFTNGTFIYTPNTDFAGIDTFRYRLSDGNLSPWGDVTITIDPVNDAPAAVADNFEGTEELQLIGDVSLNDFDVDNSSNDLTYTLFSDVSSGILVFNNDGNFTYTPNANFSGIDTFSYQVSDGLLSSIGVVTLTITNVNDAPIAQDDNYVGDEDNQIVGDVGLNDNDIDNSTSELSYSVLSDVSFGVLDLNVNGTFTYTPNAEYSGPDVFTYMVSDGKLNDSATVFLSINTVDDAPIGSDDSYTTNEDTQITGDVSTNDTDVDTFTGGSAIDNGGFETGNISPWTTNNQFWATVYSSPSYIYDGNYGLGLFSSGYIEQSVFFTTDHLEEFSFFMKSVSNNNLTVIVFYSDGTNSSFHFLDTSAVWAQHVIDASQLDNGKTVVSIRFQRINDIGVATALDNIVIELFSDLSYSVVSDVSSGILAFNSDGTFTYTPNAEFSGTDSFTYEVSDGVSSDTAIVTLNIITVNDAPVSQDDSFTGIEDTLLAGDVSINDSDVDNSTNELSYSVLTDVSYGVLVLNNNGSFTYTPNTDFFGTDSFRYELTDGLLTSNATVILTINNVKDAPVAQDDSFIVAEDTQLVGDLSLNDYDVDNATSSYNGIQNSGFETGNFTPWVSDGALYTGSFYAYEGTYGVGLFGTTSFVEQSISARVDQLLEISFYMTSISSNTVSLILEYQDGSNSTFVFLGTGSYIQQVINLSQLDSGKTIVKLRLQRDATMSGVATAIDNVVVTLDTELDYSVISDVNFGTLSLNSDGSFSYDPDTDFYGIDSFTYEVTDGHLTDTATVTITINAVNDAPISQNDSFGGAEENQVIGDVGINDSDVDNSTLELSYSVTVDVAFGTLFLNSNGSFTYTPNTDFYGTDSFTYQISDGHLIDTAIVTLTIDPINDAPISQDDSFGGDEDAQIIGDVSSNDSDVDNSTLELSYSVLTDVSFGTLSLNGDGSFTYTPDTDFFGTDFFAYEVTDGRLNDTATVTITINAVNDAPSAQDDNFGSDEEIQVSGDVGINDSDIDNSTLELSYSVSVDVNFGTLLLDSDGGFTYTPNVDFFGIDTFIYEVTDGQLIDTATVHIAINPINDAPISQDDSYIGNEDTQIVDDVSINDNDVDNSTIELSFSVLVDVNFGALTLNIDGSFTYTPNANFFGIDTFTYEMTDGHLSDIATVTITIDPVNDAPISQDDNFAGDEDQQILGDISSNDLDIDNTTSELNYSFLLETSFGILSLNSDGSFSYTPNANFFGTDSFTYLVSDGYLSDTATVILTIDPVNDAPVAQNDDIIGNEDSDISGDISENDQDIDNSAAQLSYSVVTDVTKGSLVLSSDGSFIYTPEANFVGIDSFTYEVSDGDLTDTGSVIIVVNAVNDAPEASNDIATTDEDVAIVITVLGNDLDVDGDTLAITILEDPTGGTVIINADYTITYTPSSNFNGEDQFVYQLSDGILVDTAAVTITINPVNDKPQGQRDTYSVISGQLLEVSVNDGVSSNDNDVDGDSLRVVLEDAPINGILVLAEDGSFTYTSNAGFVGTDSYSYILHDTTSNSAPVIVDIIVEEEITSDPPVDEPTDDPATDPPDEPTDTSSESESNFSFFALVLSAIFLGFTTRQINRRK